MLFLVFPAFISIFWEPRRKQKDLKMFLHEHKSEPCFDRTLVNFSKHYQPCSLFILSKNSGSFIYTERIQEKATPLRVTSAWFLEFWSNETPHEGRQGWWNTSICTASRQSFIHKRYLFEEKNSVNIIMNQKETTIRFQFFFSPFISLPEHLAPEPVENFLASWIKSCVFWCSPIWRGFQCLWCRSSHTAFRIERTPHGHAD